MRVIDYSDFEKQLTGEEGRRADVYDDATGKRLTKGATIQGHPSVGIGRNLDATLFSDDEIDVMVLNDIKREQHALETAFPWVVDAQHVSERRYLALLDMCFNLGVNGLGSFKKLLGHAQAGEWDAASAEALNSAWPAQVGHRASVVASMLKDG